MRAAIDPGLKQPPGRFLIARRGFATWSGVPPSVLRKLPFVCLKQRTEIGRNMRKRIRLYLFKP
jgi:hypothetical protein